MNKTKKLLCFVFCITLLITSLSLNLLSVVAQEQSIEDIDILGDVNGDDEVDSLDATILLKYDAGLVNLSTNQIKNGDVNDDKETDSLDASIILKYDAGIINGFYKKPDFSNYEMYIDDEGKNVINLFTKDFEKKYEKYNYDNLTLEEIQTLVNETLWMFKEFDKIVIDLNKFGSVNPYNEDSNTALAGDTQYGITTITKDEQTVLTLPYHYKKEKSSDNDIILNFYSENKRTMKNGILTIDNATISAYINNNDAEIQDEEYMFEIIEITTLRIWYYLGMPKLYLEPITDRPLHYFLIYESEGDQGNLNKGMIITSASLVDLSFKKGDKYCKLLDFKTLYGFNIEDHYIPNLPIYY